MSSMTETADDATVSSLAAEASEESLRSPGDTGPSSDRTRLWLSLSLFGLFMIILGLSVDFVLHANDANLAAEEGLFTLENPGHVLLGIGIVATAVGLGMTAASMLKTSEGKRDILRLGLFALIAGMGVFIATVAYVATGPGFGHDHGTGLSDEILLSDGVDRSALPREEAVALATLAWSRPGSLDQTISNDRDHDHGSSAQTIKGDEAEALAAQLVQARSIIPRFDTLEEVEAMGFRQGSGVSDGSGMHWIKWSWVDQPFDIERPSMLLFDELKRGKPPELIAFSYWVASEEAPDGFAGDSDKWHGHLGLCFQNGRLKNDNLPNRRVCDGDWIHGGDLWMLHAWVVPGLENRYGVFHTVNPLLCEHACGLEN